MKEEKKIVEIKTVEKLPYSEARKKFRMLIVPTFSRSYVAVVETPKPEKPSAGEKKREEIVKEYYYSQAG
jgi:hypothetical protein